MSNSKHQTPAERKYPVPTQMVSIFTPKRNALHGVEPMTGAAHRWSLETSLLTERQYNRIKGADILCAYFWPHCTDPNRYDTLLKLILHGLIVDDHLESPYGQIYRRSTKADTIFGPNGQLYAACDKVLAASDGTGHHVPAHHWKPYVLGAYAIYDTFCAAYNDVQKRRFIGFLKEWFDGNVGEGADMDRNRQFNNIDEFFEMRVKSFAARTILQVIEYADELYVPEDEWLNPIFQRLYEMLCRLVVICNDMYSFEKEVLDAGSADRVYGCVTALAQIENISLTESMQRWVATYHELEKSTMVVANEIMEADWISPDTRVFIQHGLTLIGSYWKACTLLDRYNTMHDLKEFD